MIKVEINFFRNIVVSSTLFIMNTPFYKFMLLFLLYHIVLKNDRGLTILLLHTVATDWTLRVTNVCFVLSTTVIQKTSRIKKIQNHSILACGRLQNFLEMGKRLKFFYFSKIQPVKSRFIPNLTILKGFLPHPQ